MPDWKALVARRFAGHSIDAATHAELIEELAQDFEQRAAELRAFGTSSESSLASLEQEVHELDPAVLIAVRGRAAAAPVDSGASATGWVESFVRDVVVGWRSLRRSAGATSVIVVSLGLVLGANTAIFSLTNAIYFRPLDLPNPSELVRVDALRDGRVESLSYTRFQRLRSARGLPTLSAFRFEGVEATTTSGETQRLWLDLVTGDYFHLIGITPLIGRAIDAQDEASAAEVVVVSEDYWRQHLASRGDVLGQTLRLNDRLFTIVGVMPSRYRGLHFAHRFAMAAPFTVSPTGFPNRGILATTIVARLNGAIDRRAQLAALETSIRACCADEMNATSPEAARAELRFTPVDDPPHTDPARTTRAAPGIRVELTDASRGLSWSRDFRASYKGAIVGVVSGVLLLLLIACANVATLLLVRGESRAREFAIRRSLGASVGRVRRQLFVEALELCLLGAALGLPLAWAGTMLLSRALPPSARALGDVIAWRIDTRIVASTLLITALCAVTTSLWPARRLGRDELLGALTGARARMSVTLTSQRLLVISQIALSTILITVAWLFVATTRQLTDSAAGYGSRDILLAHISVDHPADSVTRKTAEFDDVHNDLVRIAGIRSAAYAFNAPLMQDGLIQSRVEPAGWTAEPVTARLNLVSGAFFTASGSPMVRGREFMASDDAQAEPVAIVSESFERRYYRGRSALGTTLRFPGSWPAKRLRIVGIARNVLYDRMQAASVDLRNPESEMVYLPFAQSLAMRAATMVIQPAVAPAIVMASVRRTLEQHAVRVSRITSVGELLDDGASRERFSAALATGFGILAALLALTGVLGVLSYQVARRTKEIGVRMALGAQRRDAVGLVFKQTLGMVAAALLVGIPAAASAGWLIRSQLFGVAPWDPRAILTAAGAIACAGAVASLVPSYRAAGVDPLIALRED